MRKFPLFLLAGFTALTALFSCSVNKAKIDNDLKKYFDSANVQGCFTMLNNASGEVTVYNMTLDTQRFSPLATFQLVNALIGLQTGAITNDTMKVSWPKSIADASGETIDMKGAFKTNSYNYTSETAKRIGKDTLQNYIDSLGYGNKNIDGGADSFWLNNTLKISPDEQLGLMKRLYFEQLPFRKSSHQMVKDAMLQENNTNYKLSYCSASGKDENGHGIGWITGWVEENKHVYFFVTFTKGDGKEDAALSISKNILKQYGFFEGRK